MTILQMYISIFASAIFSGLLGVTVTLWVQKRRELRLRKLGCLRRIAAYRSVPLREPWFEALNEIFVTFNQSPDVINSLNKFERAIRVAGGHRNEDLLDLIKAMMKDLNLSRENLDDEFLLRPFGGRQSN
jgi:hypothetical protein